MEEIRCSKCNKLLGKVKGSYEIKCPRCKTVNSAPFESNEEFKRRMKELSQHIVQI